MLKPIDGAYRDPNHCGVYYNCINGTASIQSCPPGLHFSVKIESCNFIACVQPKDSDCKGESTQSNGKKNHLLDFYKDSYSKSLLFVDECSGRKNSTVPHFRDCRIYYHCFNNIAWPQRCPNGYFYSPFYDIQNCVYKFCAPWQQTTCSIDGKWSLWSTWSECQGLCGNKQRKRERKCNNPPPINGGLNCFGDSIQVEQCQNTNCSTTNDETLAFMVSLPQSQSMPKERINWPKIDLNNGNLYNSSTKKINFERAGMYLNAISLTVKGNSQSDFFFGDSGLAAGLMRKSNNISEDTIFRENFHDLTPSHLSMPAIYQFFSSNVYLVGSPDNRESSWLGFYYDTQNFFMAGSKIPVSRLGRIGLPYKKFRGCRDHDWYIYRCYSEGIYYVSHGIGIEKNTVTSYLKGFENPYQKIYAEGLLENSDTFTKNFILDSSSHPPAFELMLGSGVVYSDSLHLQTYMGGFKLNTSNPFFSIYGNISKTSEEFYLLPFNNVIFDNFNGWDKGSYKIPRIGTYYISTNVAICNSIKPVEIFLKINGKNKFRMVRDATKVQKSVLLSKSTVENLNKGDKIELYIKGCLANDSNQSVLNVFQIQ